MAIPGPQDALKVWHKENLPSVKEDLVTFAILWVKPLMENVMQFYYKTSLHKDSKPTATRHSFLQEQLVSFLQSLLENPDTSHQFPTLPMKSGYWETVPTHVLSVRERVRDHHQLGLYELTVSVIMESLWDLRGFFLLSPFISQYCYPLIIIHNVNNYSEASEHYLLQNKSFVSK